ncbi:MAG TPA: glycosyltransferase [Candidatus Binatia bacterium]|nr:glycosyltransferase [Candidatus Binatia bacterium]
MVELSVVIATFNRAERLGACLGALCEQSQPLTDVEVIVVVDGSADGTCEMLARLKTPYVLRVVEQQHRGQCAALNHGAEMAEGRYCLFLDDDIIASRQLLAEHLRTQNEKGGVVGIGQLRITFRGRADWFAHCFARGWTEHYEQLNQRVRSLTYEDCYGGNMSLPRAAFMAAGGFALDMQRCYDVELAYRLESQGLSFVYIEQAMGVQDERKGLQALILDSEASGKASVEIFRRHPSTLPQLLGSFNSIRPRDRLLYRLFLMLNIPARLLVHFGSVLRKPSWRYGWYCFLHRYCYWRGVRRALPDRDTWRRLTSGTPILMYHAFGSSTERESRFVISGHRFAGQMAWLRRLRYRVISLEEYLRYRREHSLPPRRSVIITIDDGYADNWAVAYPILGRYRFPATIFVVSDQIGSTYYSHVHSELNGRPMLSWSKVEALTRAGIHVGAHTRTHPDLTKIPLESAQDEIEGSKLDLERQLKMPIQIFSYPFGEINAQVQNLVEAAGFFGSCTVRAGLNTAITPLHALRRVEIHGTDSLLDFCVAVHFGHRRQYLVKRLMSWATRLCRIQLRIRGVSLNNEKRILLGKNVPQESETLGKGE